MRYIKPFLVTFTALVLICSIPISSSALGNWEFTSEFDYFTYGGAHRSTKGSPRVHMVYKTESGGNDRELLGCYHTGGSKKCFIAFFPFMGYYLISIQTNSLPIDVQDPNDTSHHGIFSIEKGKSQSSSSPDGYPIMQSYYSWYGDGYPTRNHLGLFQDVFFGYYWIFVRLNGANQNTYPGGAQYTSTGLETPSDEELDALKNYMNNNSGDNKPFPGGSATFEVLNGQKSETPTYPDGSPVPTNQAGNPVPTNEFGQTMPTLPNGKPVPTYPNGNPAEYYTDPDGTYHTVPYTIYDNANNESDVNDHFSRFNDMISDLDDLSSIMESNASDLSVHVDGTRGLVDDVLSWFPAPIIAIMVCGVIMIIAVKITGSGKS